MDHIVVWNGGPLLPPRDSRPDLLVRGPGLTHGSCLTKELHPGGKQKKYMTAAQRQAVRDRCRIHTSHAWRKSATHTVSV